MKKKVRLICAISWTVVLVSFINLRIYESAASLLEVFCTIGGIIGLFTLIMLAIIALIDYAQRPK